MEKKEAVLKIFKAVADAIKELGSVPSGHLYANVSGFLTLEHYTDIISLLEKGSFVKVEDHLITWVK